MTAPLRMESGRLRSVAFHLPQFHPIPENDAWWHPGFTEWHNVAKGEPQFRGHWQPHVPGELGFYDLRLAETRAQQAELALSHGIDAFCFYHYWFNGTRLLHEPVDRMLASSDTSIEFLLCWANESWSRSWDGRSGELLMEQTYSRDDDLRHIRHLLPVFGDERYFRVEGRPLFLVYRAAQMPDPRRTMDMWKREVTAAGLAEPYFARVESGAAEYCDPRSLGFDGAVEFQPQWGRLFGSSLISRMGGVAKARLRSPRTLGRGHRVVAYESVVASALERSPSPYPRWRCVTPMWDNSARRRRGATILHGSSPSQYERWISAASRQTLADSPRDPVIFVNAWNEWAEGCHLEPDLRWGRAYLEAHRRAVSGAVT